MEDLSIELENEARLKFGVDHDFYRQAGKEMNRIYENRPQGRDIIVVGNSSSLLSQKKGEIIDSFPNICRINDWVVRDLDHVKDVWEHTGSLITHWVSGIGSQIPSWSRGRSLKNKQTIFLLPADAYQRLRAWSFYYNGVNSSMFATVPYMKMTFCERLGYELHNQPIWKDIYSSDLYDTKNNVTFVPEYISREIAENTVDYPSTGISTIAYFKFILNMNVYTIGFDFFLKNNLHYYDDQELSTWHGSLHEFDGEAKVYKDWLDQGLIREI